MRCRRLRPEWMTPGGDASFARADLSPHLPNGVVTLTIGTLPAPGGFPGFPNRRARKRGAAGRFPDLPGPRAGKPPQRLGKPASESRKPLHGATATRETCRKVAKALHGGPATRETRHLGLAPRQRLGKPATPARHCDRNSNNPPATASAAGPSFAGALSTG